MEEHGACWTLVSTDIVSALERKLKDMGRWRYVGPKLRQLNKHWKAVVDGIGFHVTVLRYHDFPYMREMPKLLRKKNLTSFHGHPQVRRGFKYSCFGNISSYGSIQSARFSRCDNGDEVLFELLPLTHSLRKIHSFRALMTQAGMDVLTQFTRLTELRLKCAHTSWRKKDLEYHHLTVMTGLKDLSLEICGGCSDLDFVSHLTNLESFQFDACERGIKNLTSVWPLPKLTSYSLVIHDVKQPDVEFIFYMEMLTCLKINSDILKSPSFSRLTNLRKLAFHNRESRATIDGLSGDLLIFCDKLYLPSWTDGDHRVFGRMQTELEFCKNLTWLDLSHIGVPAKIMELLCSFTNLTRLLMHLSTTDGDRLDLMRYLEYPSLKTWTVHYKMAFAGAFASRSMPALKHIGFFSDTGNNLECLKELHLVPTLRQISIAVGERWETYAAWDTFRDAMMACPALKHIGYKSYKQRQGFIPEELVDHLTGRGILVDNDVSIFRRA